MSVLAQLQAACADPELSNEAAFEALQAGPAREVRLAVLVGRKAEWMAAISTFESFCATVGGRRFTVEQDGLSRAEKTPIPPVLLTLFLWAVARGLVPKGGFAYTKSDGTKRRGGRVGVYCWGTVHQMLADHSMRQKHQRSYQ